MPVVERSPDEVKSRLTDAGASFFPGNTEHERWRAELGEANAVAYADSVVVQGARPNDILRHLADDGGHVNLYFDGASRGNPGPAAIGWVLVTEDGIVDESGDRIGRATNNEAEYRALIAGLEAAEARGFASVDIRGDSELIVRQIRGDYDTNAPHLRELRVTAYELLEAFDDWSITAVPRSVNERADELANDALDD